MRVNVDFPIWMIRSLDKEAGRLGVPRQSLIKVLVARHFEEQRSLSDEGKRVPRLGAWGPFLFWSHRCFLYTSERRV